MREGKNVCLFFLNIIIFDYVSLLPRVPGPQEFKAPGHLAFVVIQIQDIEASLENIKIFYCDVFSEIHL